MLDRVSNDIAMRKFIVVMAEMPDDAIAECLDPFLAVEIIPHKTGKVAVYYADRDPVDQFRKKVDEWERVNYY